MTFSKVEMNNLPSLQHLEIGDNCLGGYVKIDGKLNHYYPGPSSLTLSGNSTDWHMIIGLPSLQTVLLGAKVFKDATALEISNLTSIQTIYAGSGCFEKVGSLSLTGMVEWEWTIELPELQSISLEGSAFRGTREVHFSELNSLDSLRIGSGFRDAPFLSLIGKNRLKN